MPETDLEIQTRLDGQIQWYDSQSKFNKNAHYISKLITIILSSLIPIAAFAANPIITASIGAIIAACEGIQYLYQWQNNWIGYRSTAEKLRHERSMYIGSSGAYTDNDPSSTRRLFLERIEDIMMSENTRWIAAREQKSDSKPLSVQSGS